MTVFTGGEGNDTVTGSSGNDAISGRGGNDFIDGSIGSDTIEGGAGVDTLLGGDGDDAIYGIKKYEDYHGTIPVADSTPDVIYGGAGNDRLLTVGYDEVYGGTGDDYVWQFGDCLTLGFATSSGIPQNTNAILETWGKPYWDLLFPLQGHANIIDTGGGNDNILLNSAKSISAGSGNDLVALRQLSNSTLIDGGEGFDTIVLYMESLVSGIYTDDFGSFYECSSGITKLDNFELIVLHSMASSGDRWHVEIPQSISANLSNFEIELAHRSIEDPTSQIYLDWSKTSASVSFKLEASYIGDPLLLIVAGYGDDVIYAGAKSDTVFGGAGDDLILCGEGDDLLYGGAGNDQIDGGDGIDRIVYSGALENYTISEITYNKFLVTDSFDVDGRDIIIDVNKLEFMDQTFDIEIRGLAIFGDDAAEEISGGDQADHIDGAGGNDLLDGSLGNDLIEGGSGNDKVLGGQGNDFMFGGTGADELDGGAGNDELDGGTDDDLVDYSGAGSDLTINLATGVATGQGTDVLISIEDVIGSSKDDSITGDDASNEITAGSGDDYVDAGSGDDLIAGGDGAGNDRYIGGNGVDTIKYTSALAGITVNLSANTNQAKSTLSGDRAGIGIDQLSGIENIIAGNHDDGLTGNASSNRIEAGSGNDTLNGGTGTDTLIGGLGDDTYITDGGDTITEGSGAGTDLVQSSATATLGSNVENLTLTGSAAINGIGNTANNIITGNRTSNTLNGGAGTDTLIGANGNDNLTGGAGNDMFIFNAVTESAKAATRTDVITDFVIGQDKINLSAIDAFAAAGANDTFIWKDTAAFNSATKGEVRYEKFDNSGTTNDYTMVWIDNDADTGVEMAIRLTGLYTLTASDFLL